jgi:hypothetical protein
MIAFLARNDEDVSVRGGVASRVFNFDTSSFLLCFWITDYKASPAVGLAIL